MVGRHGCNQPAAQLQSGRDGLGVCDVAWGRAGYCAADGEGTGGAHEMRGLRLGVGNIGEVSYEPWGFWHPSSSDDAGITRRKQEQSLVCGQGCYQPDEQLQSGRDRRGVCDRARHGLVLGRTHELGPAYMDGMRGLRLGVRDICEMPSRSRSSGHTTAGHDGRPGKRQCESGMVCGRGCNQRDSTGKSGRDGIGVSDRAGCGDGDCSTHGEGSGGAHGMRGHRLAVGDIGEMQGRTRLGAESSSGANAGIPGR